MKNWRNDWPSVLTKKNTRMPVETATPRGLIPTIVRLSPGDRQKLEAVRLKHGEKLSVTLRRLLRDGIAWELWGSHPAAGARPSFGGSSEDGAEPPVPGSAPAP